MEVVRQMRRSTLPRFFPRLAIPVVLTIVPALAQEPAPAGPAPATTQPSNPSPAPTQPGGGQVPGRQPFPGQQDPTRQQQDRMSDMMMNRPIMLSGKVVMDDGTPPPEPVLIERVCNATARPEGYTDSKGRFSFQLGQNNAVFADASTSGGDMGMSGRTGMGMPGTGSGRGISERDLIGCELRAQLPGFRSAVVQLSGRRALDNPDVGTIILQRLAKVDGFTFSGTTAFAPKDAKKAYDKARKAASKQKLDEAEASYRQAVELYPKYAVAWFELGRLLEFKKNTEEARKAFEASIAADSKYINPYGHLAKMAAMEKKWQESADFSNTLIRLNPYVSADAYFVSGIAHLNLQKLDVAEEHARQALKADAKGANPRIVHLLSVVLEQKQDLPGAAEQMRAYLKMDPDSNVAGEIRQRLGEVEKALAARQGTAAQAAQ